MSMANSTTTSKKLLRVLHVGLAGRGKWPLTQCKPEIGFVSAGLCDVSDDALAAARLITGLSEQQCYRDLAQALEQLKPDCAIICTPTRFHVPMALQCIEKNVPVLVEKGMAPDWESATRLVHAVREKRAIVAVAQNYRYNAMERTVRRAIHDDGWDAHIGPAHMITYTQQRVRPNPNTLNYPFASVWDMSCHHLDNLLDWLGPVHSVTAQAWRADWSAYVHPNNTTAHLVFQNGTHVHYIHTHDAARSSLEIQVHGQRGAIYVMESDVTFNLRPTQQLARGEPGHVTLEIHRGEAGLLEDFHTYVTQQIEPGISVYANYETMAACEMMVRSVTLNRPVLRTELDHD